MSDIAIRVENLSKQYRIGQRRQRYRTLGDTLLHLARAPFARRPDGSAGMIWALRDISFEVTRGQVVGIIGRNGAGKSTLLKILTRITEPTLGEADLHGRVGSLLEVGTGFHPELTGRENIFLNGAILGMHRAEINRRFDEIVAFAEIEQFLDTPVKRYSSGMFVRLAFAVAAHLEPEILLVDEVLAVGDAAFQKKCLGKMGAVAREGRTVLFVSHNMAAVASLCQHGLVLQRGQLELPLTDINSAVSHYLSQVTAEGQTNLAEVTERGGEGRLRVTRLAAFGPDGRELGYLASGQPVELRIYYEQHSTGPLRNVVLNIPIHSVTGGFVTMLSNLYAAQAFERLAPRGYLACQIERLPLAPGRYLFSLYLHEDNILQDQLQDAVALDVEEGDFYGTGRLPPASWGGVFMAQSWAACEVTAND
jgi:lipopolysaccharide transport system ATP-binding protein